MSTNEELFFGEISKNKIFKEGDAIKLALGVYKDGFYTDLGLTTIVGKPDNRVKRLLNGTAMALCNAINKVKEGVEVKVLSNEIESTLKKYKLLPISDITGHGVGRNLHEPPSIPSLTNLELIDYEAKLVRDTVICIEPLATLGNPKLLQKKKMMFVTADKDICAHFEIPVLVRKNGFEVLTPKIYDYVKSLI